ncbi:MAG: rhodanese-like domain-containing protein [Thermodesulfobacteriota bacterium]
MVPLEPFEKVLVSKEFLDTDHGEIACVDCHGGNATANDKKTAHAGLDPYPAANNPEAACGECHEEIVATAKDSLHTTLSTFVTVLKNRSDMNKWEEIDKARQGHCAACHTNNCGSCHVSRPKSAKKGFINGHIFQKRSDPFNQCTACHGSRVGNEYYGMRGQGDVHAAKYDMDCVACHTAEEMHAAAPEGLPGRYHLKEISACTDCHQDLEHGSVRDHAIHIGKVQCQVCHSQTYVNCYSCHVGKDEQGIGYFQNEREVEGMKIGLNYDKDAPEASYNYMLVRHEPSDLEVFDFYVKNAFTNFDKVPTWKRASPHNIQRKTWQTANCNNCHGNRDLFLADADLLDYENKANASVVVPDNKIPVARKKTTPIKLPDVTVRESMVVTSEWLHDNLGKVVLVDTRDKTAFRNGHIEGATLYDPLRFGLRNNNNLNPAPQISGYFGRAGMSADDHIVVYDKDGRIAGFMAMVLEYVGAKNVSILKGGIEGWEHHGYHLTKEAAKPTSKNFNGKARPELIVNNDYVRNNLDNLDVVIVDVRDIAQAKGLAKHAQASRPGRIPGSVNLPLSALYMDNGELKSPEELLWILKTNGITPDKTVVTTCNTGLQAAGAYFIFRYLGYTDVRVHDESWVSYCASR